MPAKKAAKESGCRCDSKPCAAPCPCTKAGKTCVASCHGGRDWDQVPCLNTTWGLKVKQMKPAEVRTALCDAGLSPIGDRTETQKRLAIFYTSKEPAAAASSASSDATSADGVAAADTSNDKAVLTELLNVIMVNEGDYPFILSLSGKMVTPQSSKGELRKAYLLVSMKVHPDKNPGNQMATKAFQVLVESFERLANPEKFEDKDDDDEDDEGKPAKKRQKTERFKRDNLCCHATKIQCPRCKTPWSTGNLGLEDSSYNFLMQGIKQYICGTCFAKFGCMTALHTCPLCRKLFEYDPDDYHRQINCGSDKCSKSGKAFGFWMFKVSERREQDIRKEVKVENEALAKKRAQQKRRNQRFDKRTGPDVSNEDRVNEQLFLLKLVDNCPRCGWELERGLKMEDAQAHLDGCVDANAIASHKKAQAKLKASQLKKLDAQETQEETQAHKTWEHNGRQVGQLWMLSENVVRKECKRVNIETDPKQTKVELIAVLGRAIRDRERKMLTMGGVAGGQVSYDVTSIRNVDEEDLPSNMESLDKEELACVAASYGLDFDSSADVKQDLITKLERARFTGKGLLAITDVPKEEKKKKKRPAKKNSTKAKMQKRKGGSSSEDEDSDSDEDFVGEEIELSD